MIEAARIIAGLLADTQDIADEDQIARVILDALDAAGFAIVPKVPTEAMRAAAKLPDNSSVTWGQRADFIWRRMLAAGAKT